LETTATSLTFSFCASALSTSAVAIAKSKYDLNLYQGDIDQIDFNEAPYDNIALFHVLEHVPFPRRLLEKCHTLLTDGGILVVAVPNDVASVKARLKVCLKRIGVRKFRNIGRLGLPKLTLDGSLTEIHLSHFTPAVLTHLLQSCGFNVLECGLDPYWAGGRMKTLLMTFYYWKTILWRMLTGVNLFDAIWMVAKKQDDTI
jgi:SAM-dependent methyltransferase